MQENVSTNFITMTLLAAGTLSFGFLPLKMAKYFYDSNIGWKRFVTSALLCFGGGVLFATSLTHMLPEVIILEYRKPQQFNCINKSNLAKISGNKYFSLNLFAKIRKEKKMK